MTRLLFVLGILVSCPFAVAEQQDDVVLVEIYKADQADRRSGVINEETAVRDRERRKKVRAELEAGRVNTASDYYHAGMVFQHGESADEIRTAFSLAWISAQLSGMKDKRALWLSSAAWDRIMMREDQPQWYGTQSISRPGGDGFELYKIDESVVTDKERDRLGVPSLQRAHEQVEFLNKHFKEALEQNRAQETSTETDTSSEPAKK